LHIGRAIGDDGYSASVPSKSKQIAFIIGVMIPNFIVNNKIDIAAKLTFHAPVAVSSAQSDDFARCLFYALLWYAALKFHGCTALRNYVRFHTSIA
jgi:hypothetical protein